MTQTKKAPNSPHGGTTTIEDLYTLVAPDIPCEYVTGLFPNTKPCNNEAEWVIHIAGHCTPEANTIRLVCDPCLKRIETGDVWQCKKCRAYAKVRDYITKTERI